MNEKKTLSQLRDQLIETITPLVDEAKILPFMKYGFQYPMFFVKLDSATVHRMVSEMNTSTVGFGRIFNEWRKEPLRNPASLNLINQLFNAFWWPSVERVWPLQCFEVHHDKLNPDDHTTQLYMLARTGPDEWIGVQTTVNYGDHS